LEKIIIADTDVIIDFFSGIDPAASAIKRGRSCRACIAISNHAQHEKERGIREGELHTEVLFYCARVNRPFFRYHWKLTGFFKIDNRQGGNNQDQCDYFLDTNAFRKHNTAAEHTDNRHHEYP
jgi:hypothetical protein